MAIEGNGRSDRDHVGSLAGGHPMGVRVIVDPDPLEAAFRLADEIGGEVIADADDARAAFAARADAGRTAPLVLDADEAERLTEQAERSPTPPGVSEETLQELRDLAEAIGRTDRIRMRTEVEFAESLNRRLSASSGVAVHPETIKQAARAVTDAERELQSVGTAITELGERPRPERVQLETPEVVAEILDDEQLEQRRRSRTFALTLLPIFGGVALTLLGLGVTPVVPIAVFVVGLALSGTLFARMVLGREDSEDRDAREASALLAAATGNAQRTSEASVRGRLAEEEWLSRRSHLETAHERAEEMARSARRHWETLAGHDADPYDLDGVLQLHDPQFVIAGAATLTSPTVRTANAVHRKAMARWKVAWAALGYEQPPPIDEMDEHLARLTDSWERNEAESAGQRLRDAAAWSNAGAIIDTPLILVEPYQWLAEEELESLVATLPAGAEVILVTS